MRDPERIERIINLIKKIWSDHPDYRFNQLIHNLSWDYSDKNKDYGKDYSYSKWETEKGVHFNKDVIDVDLFHLEDDKFEEYLQDFIIKYK